VGSDFGQAPTEAKPPQLTGLRFSLTSGLSSASQPIGLHGSSQVKQGGSFYQMIEANIQENTSSVRDSVQS
jgi:hypothetical protein